MAFVKKTWKDRIVQYANRRLLTKSGGEVEQVTVTRDEGTISEAGDQFNASNMNNLEQRIEDGLTGLTAADIGYSSGVTVKQAIDSKANISDVKELKSLSQSFTIAANSSITIQANSSRIMCLLFGVSDSQYVASVAYLIGGYVTASRCVVTNLSGLTGVTINASSTTDMKFVITNTQNFSVSFSIYNLIGSGFTQV